MTTGEFVHGWFVRVYTDPFLMIALGYLIGKAIWKGRA